MLCSSWVADYFCVRVCVVQMCTSKSKTFVVIKIYVLELHTTIVLLFHVCFLFCRNNHELMQFLRVHRNSNFVKSHGGDINKLVIQ